MLRITIHSEPKATTLRMEGRIVGQLVDELDRAGRSLASSLGSKKLLVDIREITHVDRHGRRTLADRYDATAAECVADTPMTKYFAKEAQRKEKKDSKEDT